MEKIDNGLLDFINVTPNEYFCVQNIKNMLIENGYKDMSKVDELEYNKKYFITKNDSSLIAFKLFDEINYGQTKFNITAAHCDSPSFTIKPNPDMVYENYAKINTNPYGGMINYSWFDRALSIAGRVITLKDGVYRRELINIDKNSMVIPSQAIHINNTVNRDATFDYQSDLIPVISLSPNKRLADIIREQLKNDGKKFDDICDYDLKLYNRDKATFCGINDELILSPRLDDLGGLYPAFLAFLDSKSKSTTNVFCAFNNEEIGSLTMQGADSTFLIDVLSLIANTFEFDLYSALNNSFFVSIDNAHACHPNAFNKNDPTNKVLLNNGIVIKHNNKYTTDGYSSSIFKGICNNADVPFQDYACRSNLNCGSTLGGLNQRHVSINSVDIGIAQLSMHSANETMGRYDALNMYKSILEFYNSDIMLLNDNTRILKK